MQPQLSPATRCDAAHLRWGVPKHLRCRKMACDALGCKFQHVQYFAPDFGISQLFSIRFSNGLQHSDGDLISFQVPQNAELNISNFHHSNDHRRGT